MSYETAKNMITLYSCTTNFNFHTSDATHTVWASEVPNPIQWGGYIWELEVELPAEKQKGYVHTPNFFQESAWGYEQTLEAGGYYCLTMDLVKSVTLLGVIDNIYEKVPRKQLYQKYEWSEYCSPTAFTHSTVTYVMKDASYIRHYMQRGNHEPSLFMVTLTYECKTTVVVLHDVAPLGYYKSVCK